MTFIDSKEKSRAGSPIGESRFIREGSMRKTLVFLISRRLYVDR